MDPVKVLCPCGTQAPPDASGVELFALGWRLGKKGPICPVCMGPRERRSRREAVKKYGEGAVARAERSTENGKG